MGWGYPNLIGCLSLQPRRIIHCVAKRPDQLNGRLNFLFVTVSKPPGNSDRLVGKPLTKTGKKFIEIELIVDRCQMRVKVIWLFYIHDIFHIVHRDITPKVNRANAPFFQTKVHI